jgi:transcriptional regulator with XRE-family HTH domain
MARPVDPMSNAAIAERLILTRKALGYTTTTMCELMGSTSRGSAYTNYEMGRRRIALDHALSLCIKCQLTLEWIYRGQMEGLPPHRREKFQALLAAGRQRTNFNG